MKQKLLILLCLIFLSNYTKSINPQDTVFHYLQIKEDKIINALSSCIDEMEYWKINNNKIGKILCIYVSNDMDEHIYKVTNHLNYQSSLTDIPDKYSYLEDHLILWYFGISKLEKPNANFINHINSIYNKFKTLPNKKPNERINAIKEEKITEETEMIKPLGPGRITVKEIEELGLTVVPVKIKSPRTNKIPPSPILLLRTDKNGNIRMDRIVENFF